MFLLLSLEIVYGAPSILTIEASIRSHCAHSSGNLIYLGTDNKTYVFQPTNRNITAFSSAMIQNATGISCHQDGIVHALHANMASRITASSVTPFRSFLRASGQIYSDINNMGAFSTNTMDMDYG